MKKTYLILALIVFAAFNPCRAQYVTIPDTAFVSWLQGNGYAGCMNGNQLDTTCGAVLGATSVVCSNLPIRDLTGVQYFKNLDTLYCSNDSLHNVPTLPPALVC